LNGWYSVLQAKLHSTMPGCSDVVLTVGNLFGWLNGLLPFAISAASGAFGLVAAMWLLLGPFGIPHSAKDVPLDSE